MFERKHLILAIIVIGSALGIGTYFAYNSSTEFLKGQIIPTTGAFEITQPSAEETNVSITPIIKWSPVTDAIKYYVTILHETGGEIVRDATVTDNNFSLPISSALSYRTRYSVIVEATDVKGDKFTANQWFTTQSAPISNGILIINPISGSKNVSITPAISWTSIEGANSYNLSVSSLDPGVTPITENVSGTSILINNLNTLSFSTEYNIEIEAIDISGNILTTGSAVFSTRDDLHITFNMATASTEIIDGLPVVDTNLCLRRPTVLTDTDQIPQHPKCNIVTFSATPTDFNVSNSYVYVYYVPDTNAPDNYKFVTYLETKTSGQGHTERVTWDGTTCGTIKKTYFANSLITRKVQNFVCPTNIKYYIDFYLFDKLSGDVITATGEFYLKGN